MLMFTEDVYTGNALVIGVIYMLRKSLRKFVEDE